MSAADRLLAELDTLAAEFDEQARDRAREGMAASADAYRDCRDAVRALARRLKKEQADERC
jgi:hypothetical protein